MTESVAGSPELQQLQSTGRLDSWKEIAAHLRRSVRTAQLWEKTERLPVRRHNHKLLASVYAYRSDIDAWWHRADLPATLTRDRVRSAAHQAYLEGRFYSNRRTPSGLATGIACFKRALHAAPNYALACTGLADCYAELGFYGVLPARTAITKAKPLITKALEMDEMLPEAHISLADVMSRYEWNFPAAEREYRRAIALNPNHATGHHWYADYLAMMGRFDEAFDHGKRALELDPVSPVINVWLGMNYYLRGLYNEALEQYKRTLDMHPNYILAHWASGLAYEQRGNTDQAIFEKKRALSLSNHSAWLTAGLGYSYALAGRCKEAKVIIHQLTTLPQQGSTLFYELATIHAAMREPDQAIWWLEKAYQDRCQWMPYLNVEPRLECLRSNARFQDLNSSVMALR